MVADTLRNPHPETQPKHRDREKTIRGLKTKETPIPTGYQIFRNYSGPHEGLGGKRPSK
jgi:hypothetical protein